MSKYIKKPITVEAVKLLFPATLTTPTAILKAKAGDYLVSAGKEQFFVTKDVFELTYQEAADPDMIAPMEVENLVAFDVQATQATISYIPPADADYAKANVYVNGVLTTPTVTEDGAYVLANLTPETTYTVLVTAEDKAANESAGVSIEITTPVAPVEEEPAV